jgi:hypothetical protein
VFEGDCVVDGECPVSHPAFDIAAAQIEAIIEPDGVADDIGRESMALVCIHTSILSRSMP